MNGLQSGERKALFFEPCGIDFGCMFHRSMHIGARGGRFFDSFDTFSALRQKSRGTPAMQEKTTKPREPAATVCHPVSRGSKICLSQAGASGFGKPTPRRVTRVARLPLPIIFRPPRGLLISPRLRLAV